ncbi:MAG: pyruvate synthase subunit beta [Euryarchaeota archaeon]|nr:pyruvate synthase subunit beta [Euryarchaeota archaeon]
MKITEKEFLAPGHRACAGCGEPIGVRLALKVLGENTIAVSPTGCLEVITSPYPETAWEIPWIHVAFENAGAVASGVEAALKSLGRKSNVVVFAGDGGTADIGFQSLSGAMERNHDIIYICIDNEAYMNTGVQRSGATPYGASTMTSPAGKKSFGEDKPKKNLPMIMVAHNVPYVATASISYPEDFMKKVKKASETEGSSYIHLHQPCTTGWGFDPSKTIELGRLAVETGAWILYEVENGDFKVTYRPAQRKPLIEYLKAQKRFKHLKEAEVAMLQDYVDRTCSEYGV